MKYMPAVNIGNDEVAQLQAGTLRLQPGQWIRLEWGGGRLSRWVGITPAGALTAIHWDGKHDGAQFSKVRRSLRGNR